MKRSDTETGRKRARGMKLGDGDGRKMATELESHVSYVQRHREKKERQR